MAFEEGQVRAASFPATGWERDIHRFRMGGLNLVLDVNGGSVHLLDDLCWDLLGCLEDNEGNSDRALAILAIRYGREQAEGGFLELLALVSEGLLFSAEAVTEGYVLPEGGLKSLCLHVAHDCNLRCRYCFASAGDFGGRRQLMQAEVGRAALEMLYRESGQRRFLEVDFFGGEPLLNLPLVRELVAYGKARASELGKEVRFTLTTNGLLLDARAREFLNREGLQVILSLDGRPGVHDAMRRLPGGGGSYDLVLSNFRELVSSRRGEGYHLRGTFTAHNLDFSSDVLHMAGLGFDRLSVEPVVEPGKKEYALREKDLPEVLEEYERLAEALVEMENGGRRVRFFHFEVELKKGLCLPRRLSGCGAGYEYLAVTPEGELYPCHQFVGRAGFQMGDVFKGVPRADLRETFRTAHSYNKKECRGCWARFLCGGGCHANNQAFNGDLLRPYNIGCVMQKKRLECAIFVQVKRLLRN